MKKKIGLFLVSTPNDGGTFQHARSVLEALEALPPASYDVVVGYESGSWAEHLRRHKVRVFHVVPGFFSRAIRSAWRMLRLPVGLLRIIAPYFHPSIKAMVKEGCALWVFPSEDPYSFYASVPSLTTMLDLMHRYERQFPEVSANGMYEVREYYGKNVAAWTKGVLVDSELGRRMASESYGIPMERIFALPCIPPHYIYADHVPADFEAKYALPKKYLFYPAQFWMHKNHPRLIRSVAEVRKAFPDVALVLAGAKKNGYDEAERLVKEMGLERSVLFLGYVPDEYMAELYRRARALVMPTFFGPTNIPQLEAFHLGCPVATSNIYGIPHQVGDAALLFNPNSVDEIADCIRRLWSDDELCRVLIERGKKKSAEWGQAQFNAVFREILDTVLARIENE